MGLFVSIPVDVMKTNLLVYLIDYLDRLHLAMTCSDFWEQMKNYDPLTNSIASRNSKRASILIAEQNDFRSLSRFLLISRGSFGITEAACQKLSSINVRLLRQYASETDYFQKRFDIDVMAWACKYYGGSNIPQYYYTLCGIYHERLCSAFAIAGNFELFNKYYQQLSFGGAWHEHQTKLEIAYSAGCGGNKEICNVFLNDDELTGSICRGICELGKPEYFEIIENYPKMLQFCWDEMQKYPNSCQEKIQYLKDRFPDLYLKNKRIKL